jgi:hypothetical protein
MLCVSLVITTCHVLELQLEKTALKYAEYLWISHKRSQTANKG